MAPTPIVDPENVRATPSEMAPTSQAVFVFHPGHQTILDARDPLWRQRLGLALDLSVNPLQEREFRQVGGALVQAALGGAS